MLELADIFRRYGAEYRARFQDRRPSSHLRAMRDIEDCRTAALGGQVYLCSPCQLVQYAYHSCKNRHCPKCQNEGANLWLQQQRQFLLPVPYFLVTFTLPEELRSLARSHQKILYHLLFQTAAAALQKLAHDPRRLGGQIGMLGVLQTWARDLSYHPHVHFVVPGGAISSDSRRWRSTRHQFFLPEKPLACLFRGKFRAALKKAGLLKLVSPKVWNRDWVVDCEPVGNGYSVLKYLAPYIYRIALSNNRLVSIENGQVTFRYQETKSGQWHPMTLAALVFIRRFLQHVLPHGFVKVRYYGFLSPRHRKRLEAMRQILGATPSPPHHPTPPDSPAANHLRGSPGQPSGPRCPQCGHVMTLVEKLSPTPRAPP